MVAVGWRRGERGNMTKHIKLSSLKQTNMKSKPKSCGVRYHVLSRAHSHPHPMLAGGQDCVLYQRRRRRLVAVSLSAARRPLKKAETEEAAHTRHHGANPSPGEYTSCCKIFRPPTADHRPAIDNHPEGRHRPDRFHPLYSSHRCFTHSDPPRAAAGSQPHDDISRSLLWVKQR